jgi:hypothetical protein
VGTPVDISYSIVLEDSCCSGRFLLFWKVLAVLEDSCCSGRFSCQPDHGTMPQAGTFTAMAWAQQCMKDDANHSRQAAKVLKKGDKVWLKLKNISTP